MEKKTENMSWPKAFERHERPRPASGLIAKLPGRSPPPPEPSRSPGTRAPPTANLTGLLRSNLQEDTPRLPLPRRRVRESLAHDVRPHEPLLPRLARLQPEEAAKRVPRRLPRAPDRRQHLARRRPAGRAALGAAGVVLGRGVGLVELQSLSARTVDAGAGAG